jgi:guanylate kinase
MKDKGILMVISGPSGSGKGTVVKELVKEEDFALSISATTRKPRIGEKDGVEYFFKSEEEFKQMINDGKLLEWANFVGHYYGTPKDYVLSKLNEGKSIVLEIEVQGAEQIKKIYPDTVLIFLVPPSRAELEKRLIGRGTEDIETIKKRIKRSVEEIKLIDKYDYVVINDEVENAVRKIKEIVDVCKIEGRRFCNFAEKF